MEPELNCSSQCDSPLCFIQSGVNREDGLDILQRLCGLSTVISLELPRRSLSPVLSAVVWTLLSCGILLAFCFLLFTLRFKNNRIVKMSSPNLNVLTLFGSVLTYSSGFLFVITWCSPLQARMWMLCVGSTLVFGPILGKTWRLYRVFTQRVPDKRVIIRDIQLMGMVALLILVDMLVLTAWNLADPIRCLRSVGAVVKVVERDISYSLSQLDSCSSVYSNLWIIIIVVLKGCLLLYGTYLAGLTSNVSHPPVNQSPTIITTVSLVTFSSAVAIPVSVFLQAWPNLVYGTMAGAIFICTLATNCMLFVNIALFVLIQNARSQCANFPQEQIFSVCLKLVFLNVILQKNAVIDSLQEQVNNAKDKLLRLMSASQPSEDQDMDSSATNLNSSSTQTTELQSEGPSSSSLSQRESKSRLSPPHLSPYLPAAPVSLSVVSPSSEPPSAPNFAAPISVSSPLPVEVFMSETQRDVAVTGPSSRGTAESRTGEDLKQSLPFPGLLRTAEETVQFVTSLQSRRGLNPSEADTQSGLTVQLGPNARPAGFISSEQLQEILQELSVDAVMETTLRSPGQASRTTLTKTSALSPLSFISPYAMRKRRPPFHSPRRGLSPPCFFTGSEIPACGKTGDTCKHQNNPGELPEGITVDDTFLRVYSSDLDVEKEEEEEDAEGHGVRKKCQRCILRSHRCAEQHEMEVGGENEQRHKRIRDSCGYWDSDSSSSTDYCYYHRPYCDSCLQRGSLLSSDSSSDSSDSEYDDYTSLYRSPRPVVFKEDLKPTFV
uniref:G protein-coupled receptor 156 n=1 Tax=Amphiprion percula TaxID=161767 RepID=A0A3P8RJG7_AMPPE